ncbi:MAG TPA: hypothetical protein PLC89_03510 [Haliscomenobacter sp.]|uniref:hypothetical protein n=1 Tax=Haliscomenobacter sp. TaxID=2717303 RepID=UPI002D12A7AD|nr:hypothetical protein [Haliscomenobacter sp.]HOY16329.1 hypothetical protein [Haliscomenobacter sp.]HPH19138.1 hypothetical protein [Haliscomenobacter sp.]
MKSLHKFFLLSMLVLSLFACEDEDAIRIPEFLEGANMRIVLDAAKSSLRMSSISNSTIEFDAYSINTNLQKVEFIGAYVNKTDTVENEVLYTLLPSAFVGGKARGVITAADVVKAFKLAGISSLSAGDLIFLETHVTLTDGRVFSAENSAPSILQGTYPSFTPFLDFDIKP